MLTCKIHNHLLYFHNSARKNFLTLVGSPFPQIGSKIVRQAIVEFSLCSAATHVPYQRFDKLRSYNRSNEISQITGTARLCTLVGQKKYIKIYKSINKLKKKNRSRFGEEIFCKLALLCSTRIFRTKDRRTEVGQLLTVRNNCFSRKKAKVCFLSLNYFTYIHTK